MEHFMYTMHLFQEFLPSKLLLELPFMQEGVRPWLFCHTGHLSLPAYPGYEVETHPNTCMKGTAALQWQRIKWEVPDMRREIKLSFLLFLVAFFFSVKD